MSDIDKIQSSIKKIILEKKFVFVEKDSANLLNDYVRFLPKEFYDIVPTPKNARKFTKVCWIEITSNTKSSPDIFNRQFNSSLSIILVVASYKKETITEMMFKKANQKNGAKIRYFNNMDNSMAMLEKDKRYLQFHVENLLDKYSYKMLLTKNETEIMTVLEDIVNNKISEFID